MPAPIIIEDMSGLSQGIAGAGSALAQALQYRAQQNQQQEALKTFQDELILSPDDPNALSRAFAKALSAGGNRTDLMMLADQHQQVRKQNAFRTAFDIAMDAGGMATEGGQHAFLQAYSREGGDPLPAMKYFSDYNKIDPEKKSTYNQNQKMIAGISSDAKKAKSMLKESDNVLAAIQSRKLPGRGIMGSITENIYDLFNAAPKEVQRLKSIAKRSILEMGDLKGFRLTDQKLKFLEDNLFNPRKSREENEEAFRLWRDLLQDYVNYEGAVSQILSEDKDAIYDPTLESRISDVLHSATTKAPGEDEAKEKVVDKLSNTGYKKGDVAKNTETGEKFIYNGTRWIKQR